MSYQIAITVKSDATFGRGEGLAGLIDTEIEHDELGLPFLRGRALKGLLVEECANLIFVQRDPAAAGRIRAAAAALFGRPGSLLTGRAGLFVGPAQIPADLREAIRYDVERGRWRPDQVLAALTAVRRQTAVDEETGSPAVGTLRAQRVLLRETPLAADLVFRRPPDPDQLAVLAACVLALRRAGTRRNRGRGRLSCRLHDQGQDVTLVHAAAFAGIVGAALPECAS